MSLSNWTKNCIPASRTQPKHKQRTLRRSETPLNTSKLQLEWRELETGRHRSKSSCTSDPQLAERRRQDLEYEAEPRDVP